MNNLLPGLAQRLAALTRDAVQTTGSISAISDQLPEFQPGERYTARILQTLRDGLVRADIGGQAVTVRLPEGAPLPQGSTVTLTHVQRSAQTLIATLDGDTRPAAANATPQTDDAAAVRLSNPARTIAGLLDDPLPQPPRLANGQPMLDPARMLTPGTGVPTGNAMPQIAGRLAQAIGESGLFYESHQAQWVAGQRPIEASAAEPQRAFDPGTPQPAASDRSAAATLAQVTQAGSPTTMPDAAPTSAPDSEGVEPPLARSESNAQPRDEAARTDDGPPAELRPLVQNQLLGLSQHTLAWDGLAWPGQPMRLEIDDPQPERGGSGDTAAEEGAPEVPWTTRVRMVLPGLGEIETSLTLWNKEHALTLGITADGDARLRMGAGLLDLQQRMTDAGLRLGSVNFSDAPTADRSAGGST